MILSLIKDEQAGIDIMKAVALLKPKVIQDIVERECRSQQTYKSLASHSKLSS